MRKFLIGMAIFTGLLLTACIVGSAYYFITGSAFFGVFYAFLAIVNGFSLAKGIDNIKHYPY